MSKRISREDEGGTDTACRALSRRRMLLAGTVLAASSLSGEPRSRRHNPRPRGPPAPPSRPGRCILDLPSPISAAYAIGATTFGVYPTDTSSISGETKCTDF
jgi:hypothetical protein